MSSHGNDGATVHAVETGTKTLKDAADAAFKHIYGSDAFYVLKVCCWPTLTQPLCMNLKQISEESKRQVLGKEGRLPDYVTPVSVGDPISVPSPNMYDEEVKLVGVEAAGHGLTQTSMQRP